MDELVKRHPLYPQLAHFDDDIAALNLRGIGAGVTASPEGIAGETKQMQAELGAATARAKTQLTNRRRFYQMREGQAVRRALVAAGYSATGAAAVERQIARTSAGQARGTAADAGRTLQAYQTEVAGQDRSELTALQTTLNARASQRYAAERGRLRQLEAEFVDQQARTDAPQRLELQAKLANLALDDQSRKALHDQLDGLERTESDALAEMRNRDQATLAALQVQLRGQAQAELSRRADELKTRSLAKLAGRRRQLQQDLVGQIRSIAPPPPAAAIPPLPADLRDRIEALHRKFQAAYEQDAQTTIRQFDKTKTELDRRYAALRAADTTAQTGARAQLATLQKQRDQLYDQIVAQIDRAVARVAQDRGVTVVLRDVVVPAGAIDLTPAARKDIASLRE